MWAIERACSSRTQAIVASFACALLLCAIATTPCVAAMAADETPADQRVYAARPDYTPALSIHDENEGNYTNPSFTGALDSAQATGSAEPAGSADPANPSDSKDPAGPADPANPASPTDPANSAGPARTPLALIPQADDELPSRYSSVEQGNVTPVRSQSPFGTCWAFSTIAAVESSLIAHGQAAADELDLSERHLAYFTYHAVTDPTGYTVGDLTIPGYSAYGDTDEPETDTYLNAGGNPSIAMNVLTSWRGAVNETEAPYDELASAYNRYRIARWSKAYEQIDQEDADDYTYEQFLVDTKLADDKAYDANSWHVTGAFQISLKDADDVKRTIMGGLLRIITSS